MADKIGTAKVGNLNLIIKGLRENNSGTIVYELLESLGASQKLNVDSGNIIRIRN